MKVIREHCRVAYLLVLYVFLALLFTACTAKTTARPSATPTHAMIDFSPMPGNQASTATVMDLSPTPTAQPPAPTTKAPSPTPTAQATATLPEPTVQPTLVENTATPLPTPEPTATPTQLGIGSTRVIEIDHMVQVYVPAGDFLMGAAASDINAKQTTAGGRAYPEIPQTTVYLDSYWIDKYEVTNGQYALCVAAGACQLPWVTSSYTYDKYYGNPEFDNYPVIWVNWFKARDYCTWAGRRLPTEAEWEKAARGTDGRMYPWGNEPVDGTRANFCDVNCTRSIANTGYNDGYPDTAPVGSYPAGASPYGAMDMSGNVWEWVNSLIMPYPYDANDGREDPNAPGERAWRGGPWSNGYWWMRSSVRYRSVNWYQWYVLGFRCASTP
jgi:formylglycine-generating enzyme required for sulfatase activity